MSAPVLHTVSQKSDAAILSDLQGWGFSTEVSNFSSVSGLVITWASAPSAFDANEALSYFQTGSHLTIG